MMTSKKSLFIEGYILSKFFFPDKFLPVVTYFGLPRALPLNFRLLGFSDMRIR